MTLRVTIITNENRTFINGDANNNKVVVNNKNGSAPVEIPQRLKLSQHLLITFSSWHTAIDFNDVAKLARERTTT